MKCSFCQQDPNPKTKLYDVDKKYVWCNADHYNSWSQVNDTSAVRVQAQVVTIKSKVIAEFVDEIPKPKDTISRNRTSWEPQDGLKEGLEKAMRNPGRALLLLKYGEGSMSRRKALAKWRVEALEKQGYRENMGWTVRAVDDEIYVIYEPVRY